MKNKLTHGLVITWLMYHSERLSLIAVSFEKTAPFYVLCPLSSYT